MQKGALSVMHEVRAAESGRNMAYFFFYFSVRMVE